MIIYILTNKVDVEITSGNIISDISDHYSQFCISHNFIQRPKCGKQKRRDFSGYSRSKFNFELSDALVSQTNFSDQFDVDTAFSYFYNTLLALVDKHAPLKTVSNRKLKQFSIPWIASGLRKSIKIKNSLLQSGDLLNYKIYRNKISSLTQRSKKNYYHAFFAENLNNMKNTWNGINRLINDKKNRKQVISSLKRPDNNSLTNDPLEISNIFSNNDFSSVGENLASCVPRSSRYFTEYL